MAKNTPKKPQTTKPKFPEDRSVKENSNIPNNQPSLNEVVKNNLKSDSGSGSHSK